MQEKIIRKYISLLIILLITTVFPIENIEAIDNIIYVNIENYQGPWDGTAEHPYQTIQEGINAVAENGTVYVSNGTYQGPILINKTIKLIGTDKTNTTIDGNGNKNSVIIIADEITLQGFTIINCTTGINMSKTSNTNITQNTLSKIEYGIYLTNQSNHNTIYNNNFLKNTIHAYDNGINIWNHTYPTGGNYWDDYNGTDSNNDGIGDTPYNIAGGKNQDIYPLIEPITEKPFADFTFSPTNPTTQDIIQITDTSTDPDGHITTWSWNFGDQNTSAIQHPTKKYTDDGIYTITLTVTDNYGATDKKTRQITILNVAPIPNFNYFPATPTDLEVVIFNDKSFDMDGTIAFWNWDFGDGNTSNEQNPTHQYADNGIYTITVNVTDDDGAEQKTTKQITIQNVAPQASFSFSPAEPTTNDTIQFLDHSKDNDGEIITWNWNFDDGTTSTEKSPTYNYKTEGTYRVLLKVNDNDGDTETITKYIIVLPSTPSNERGIEEIAIYFVYLALFIIMIGMVFWLKRKYE
ncbi:MAG: PKD domain-containing protein [Thermoplasmatales archaeon]|nr:MAG: PKD domain-containing protein [Thermoplasmatales archaeon]